MNLLNKISHQQSVGVGSGTKTGEESATSPKTGNPAQNRGHGVRGSSPGLEGNRCQIGKEGRPLFSTEESKLLTAFVVETQQAFSLMTAVDIDQGEIEVCDKTRAFRCYKYKYSTSTGDGLGVRG